jgi:pectate lyase C
MNTTSVRRSLGLSSLFLLGGVLLGPTGCGDGETSIASGAGAEPATSATETSAEATDLPGAAATETGVPDTTTPTDMASEPAGTVEEPAVEEPAVEEEEQTGDPEPIQAPQNGAGLGNTPPVDMTTPADDTGLTEEDPAMAEAEATETPEPVTEDAPVDDTMGGFPFGPGSDMSDPSMTTDDTAQQQPDTGEQGGPDNSGAECTGVSGEFGVVNATIIVGAGQTYDGQCQRYVAGPAVGDGSQSESQLPVFRVEQGATLKNVVLGAPAADGIHVHGSATLTNIVWEDIGEDAMTIKESGEVTLNGGAAYNSADKVFQINAASTFRVSNFTADTAGKFIRQNGNTTFHVDVYVDGCDISNMKESIFRTDSGTSTLTLSNTRYHAIGEVFRRGGDRNAAYTDAGGNSSY